MLKKHKARRYLSERDRHRKTSDIVIPFKRGGFFEKGHAGWSLFIMLLSFLLSILLLFASSSIFDSAAVSWAYLGVVVIISVGIFFDMIGVAVAAAEETPFHSMAARKIIGAKESIRLIRNAPRVSSVCNDVIGDICSVVSGTAGAAIVFRLAMQPELAVWPEAIMGAVIAALTVGGKAVGKGFGIKNSNYIIFIAGRFASLFTSEKPKARKVQNNRSNIKT